MKTLNLLVSAALATFATVAFSDVARAGVSTTGQTNPSPISVNGTITKYVNFVINNTIINMRDFGGPAYTGNFVSGQLPAGHAGDDAQVTFDANTHISVNIVNGEQFRNNSSGAHHDELLATEFKISVKGNDVRKNNPGGAVAASSNAAYVSQGYSPASPDFPAAPISNTFVYGSGSGNGLLVGAKALRSGLSDHHGVYATSQTTLTWLDLG